MKRPSAGALILAALAGILAMVFLCWRGAGAEAAYPVENAKTHFVRRIWSRVCGCFRGAEAQAENYRLRRELGLLALMRGDMERLEAENGRLRKSLGYAQGARGDWLPAAVLTEGGGAAAARRTLRVDRGSSSGVKAGAVVVVPEGLVGRVTAVTPHTSEVLLLTDPAVRVSCEVEMVGDVLPRGILTGGSGFRLEHLRPDGLSVPPRSRVITSGIAGEGGFPRGIEVGTYVGNGVVEPSVDYSELEDVFIRRGK